MVFLSPVGKWDSTSDYATTDFSIPFPVNYCHNFTIQRDKSDIVTASSSERSFHITLQNSTCTAPTVRCVCYVGKCTFRSNAVLVSWNFTKINTVVKWTFVEGLLYHIHSVSYGKWYQCGCQTQCFNYLWHEMEKEQRRNDLKLSEQNVTEIQGDSGGICTTLGNDSMSDSKQKSS